MVSLEKIRKGFRWWVDQLEETTVALRLKDIIERMASEGSLTRHLSELGIVLVALLYLKKVCWPKEDEGLTLLRLKSATEIATQMKFSKELDYFTEFLKHVSRPSIGEKESVDCFIYPLRGRTLWRPPSNFLASLAQLVSEKRIRFSYFLLFEKRELGELDPSYLLDFIAKLKFADISLIIVDAEIRERFELPKRTRINSVTLANQRVAFTHNRDQSGHFTGAKKYYGASAQAIFSLQAKLKLLAEPIDAFNVGTELRSLVQRDNVSFFPKMETPVNLNSIPSALSHQVTIPPDQEP